MSKLKYCCIGTGGIAKKKHITGYSRLPDVEVAAVCDTSGTAAAAAASQFGVPHVYTDYKVMLEEIKPDIVSVCTPNCTHAPIAIDCLRAGANVHVEKPMAMNAAEAQAIIDVEKETGKTVMLGLNKRFIGVNRLVYRLLQEDFFGSIYKVRCGWERSSGIPGIGRWFTNKAMAGGGVLIDLGVHYLDLAMFFLGWPEAKDVTGGTFINFGKGAERIRRGYKSDPNGIYDVEDSAIGTLHTETGVAVDFTFSWASNIEKEKRYVEFMGTKGGMTMVDDHIKLYSQFGGTMFTLTPDEATIPLDLDECAHFVDYLTGRTDRLLAPSCDGLKMMKVIDGIYRSAEERREIILKVCD